MYFIGFQQPQLLGTSPGSMRSPEYLSIPMGYSKKTKVSFLVLLGVVKFSASKFQDSTHHTFWILCRIGQAESLLLLYSRTGGFTPPRSFCHLF